MPKISTALVLAIAMIACESQKQQPPAMDATTDNPLSEAVLHVEVLYRERIALPASATLSVSLEEISKADGAATIVTKKTEPAKDGPPFRVSLAYSPSELIVGGKYGIRARIENEGKLTFINEHFVPAFGKDGHITESPNDPVRVLLERTAVHKTSAGTPTSLTGVEWTLVELDGKPAVGGADGKYPQMTFESAEERVSGFAGCNRFSGRYELGDGASIAFPAVSMTSMACPEGMELERDFGRALGRTATFVLEGNTLELLDKNGKTVAKFSRPGKAD